MTEQPKGNAKAVIKRKANDLRKTLAQLDKLTGQSFVVSRLIDVANFFGTSQQAVDKWRAAGMPGVRNNYDLHSIVIWLRSEGPWRPAANRAHGDAEDLIGERVESEWSEEYRKWKARIAEADYNLRIGRLMNVERTSRIWSETVMPLVRGFAERVIRAHGNGTAQDWEDTCRQIDGAIERELNSSDETDGDESLEELDAEAAPETPVEPTGLD